MTLNIAALASGRGSNVAAILAAIESGKLDARMVLVASNNPEAPVLAMAQSKGIAVWAESHKAFADRASFDTALAQAITAAGADTLVLAGYMRILTEGFVRRFAGRILNIHPALLPSFPGAHGGPDALAYGVRVTGATVHFVDEIMDHGPVIIQGVVPLSGNDTENQLMPRIHALEHRIFPQALQWLAEGRLHLDGRRVRLAPQPHKETPALHESEEQHPLATTGRGEHGPWLVSPPLESF